MVQQLAELFHGVAHVGAQHVFAEELMEHLAYWRLQEGHATGVARAVPGVGAVLRVMHQRAEERRCQAVEIGLRFADDVAGHKLRRVFEHVNEAVQLAQNVVRDVARGAGLTVDVDGDVGVLVPDLAYKSAQGLQRRVDLFVGTGAELFIVDREDEGRCARLLLSELRQITVAGHAQHFHAFFFNGVSQGADAQARGVFGAEVFVDDDDRETEFHEVSREKRGRRLGGKLARRE